MKSTCPKCNSKNTVRIVYGMPECLDRDDNIWLGGYLVTDYDIERHCNDCETDFSRKIHENPTSEIVHVETKPGAHANDCAELADGTLLVRVTAKAHDGEANKAVAKVVAEHYDLAPTHVKLTHGATSRHKVFELS